MRTQVMSEIAIDTPWLEHTPPGGEPEKTPIESFPFTIGRNHSTDLQIDSNQVSREHAVITRHGKKYKVRDLGSTNGTFLNGEQIDDATLGDGDILMIADMEFTFFCDSPGSVRQTATQVIGANSSKSSTQETVWDAIFAVRRTQEVVTLRALRTLFQPIIEVNGGKHVGYEAFAAGGPSDTPSPRCDGLAAPVECRANDRMRQLFRRLAVEDIARLPQGGRLFLGITAAESTAPWLAGHLCQLREAVDERWQLVVEIPDSAVRSTADFRSLLTSLRAARIQVAYDGYASGKAQITERKDVAPDFLKLAPSLVRSISRGKDRQRQVQLIVRASHEIDCAVIATGIDQEGDLNVCRDLGCTLAQGDLFSPVTYLSGLTQAGGASAPQCVTAS